MKFVDALLGSLANGFNFVGRMIYKMIEFLAKPLSYVFYFFDAVFYFFYQLFNVAVKIIMIFVALLQFFVAIVAGFLRTIFKMLTIDFSATPVHYPNTSYKGIQAVIDILQPVGGLTVVPGILLAITWFFFARKVIGLLGRGGGSDS